MEECNICFNNLDSETAWTCPECNQICHQFCLETWYENRKVCPFCIQNISNTPLTYVNDEDEH